MYLYSYKKFREDWELFLKDVETLFRGWGWEEWADRVGAIVTTGSLILVVLLGMLLYFLSKKFPKWRKNWREQKERKARKVQRETLLKDLFPYFDQETVDRAQTYFIESKGQNIAPSREAELGDPQAFVTREPLIPHFLDKTFKGRGSSERFYLVLGDSGTGKTTFMVNLFQRYIELTEGKEFSIALFPLGYPGIDDAIHSLIETGKDKETLLLLDAFDEDPEAVDAYSKRMNELIELCKHFRALVITSRTQFFPDDGKVPGEINIPKPGTNNPGFHTFKVIYLSPFDQKDITTYLEKKYSGNTSRNRKMRLKAQEIVGNSPAIMVRPMLLARIDDFMEEEDKSYKLSVEIYAHMIDKWIEREGGRKPKGRRERFKRELRQFSHQLALELYKLRQSEDRSFIKPAELRVFIQSFDFNLSELEMRSQSLLNRDAQGNLKFSHKSIWEYFLAMEANENNEFQRQFGSFEGWDVVAKFLSETLLIHEMVQVEGGSFIMGSNEGHEDERPIHEVILSPFEIGKYPVTQAKWEAVMGENPSEFKDCPNCPVECVSWEAVDDFIKKLNQLTGRSYRLPTEAEWEFAARGRKKEGGYAYAGSNELEEVGWYWKNSGNSTLEGELNKELIIKNNCRTHPVGKKKANELGIHDMSGNVWEWCGDWYGGDYYAKLKDSSSNPKGPRKGQRRVLRGGAAAHPAAACPIASATAPRAVTALSAFASQEAVLEGPFCVDIL